MSRPASAIDLSEFTASLGTRIDGFFYRGLNSADYAMVWVSEGFQALTGLDPRSFVSERRAFSDLIHPDDLAGVNQGVERALASNGRWQVLYRLKKPGGGWRFVHETGGGCDPDPATGAMRYLDGVILEADRVTQLSEQLMAGRSAVKAMNGSIDEIFRTLKTLRLLSLNARIEAARAQQHGAGFGVVAQEMLNLAGAGESVTRAIESELGRLNTILRL